MSLLVTHYAVFPAFGWAVDVNSLQGLNRAAMQTKTNALTTEWRNWANWLMMSMFQEEVGALAT